MNYLDAQAHFQLPANINVQIAQLQAGQAQIQAGQAQIQADLAQLLAINANTRTITRNSFLIQVNEIYEPLQKTVFINFIIKFLSLLKYFPGSGTWPSACTSHPASSSQRSKPACTGSKCNPCYRGCTAQL